MATAANSSSLFKDTGNFYPDLYKLMGPILLQSIMTVLLGFIDVFMVTRIGETALAAVSVSNQVFMVLYTIFVGLAAGGGVYFSRYWGAKEFHRLAPILTITAGFTCVIGTLIAVLSAFNAHLIVGTIVDFNEKVTNLGAGYLAITAISFPFVAISTVLTTYFRNVGKSKIPMFASISVIAVNTILNYFLIFGIGPFPRLGVDGAAIATVIARFVELVLLFSLFKSKINPIQLPLKDYLAILADFKQEIKLITAFLLISIPLSLTDMIWATGQIAYRYLYSHMSISILAGVSASENLIGFFNIVFMAFAFTSTIMVGRLLGEKNYVQAKNYVWRFVKLVFLVTTALGGVLYFISPAMASVYNLSDETSVYFIQDSQIAGIMLGLRSLAALLMGGVVRAGGRSVALSVLQFSSIWLVSIPLSFIAYLVFGAPFWVVCVVSYSEMLVKVIFCLYSLYFDRWIKDIH